MCVEDMAMVMYYVLKGRYREPENYKKFSSNL